MLWCYWGYGAVSPCYQSLCIQQSPGCSFMWLLARKGVNKFPKMSQKTKLNLKMQVGTVTSNTILGSSRKVTLCWQISTKLWFSSDTRTHKNSINIKLTFTRGVHIKITHICTYSGSSSASSTERSVGLKIAPSDGWGRGGVIPDWINIEQQPDGDETRKHQDERRLQGERRGRTSLIFAFTCRHTDNTHAASHSHTPTSHNTAYLSLLIQNDIQAQTHAHAHAHVAYCMQQCLCVGPSHMHNTHIDVQWPYFNMHISLSLYPQSPTHNWLMPL